MWLVRVFLVFYWVYTYHTSYLSPASCSHCSILWNKNLHRPKVATTQGAPRKETGVGIFIDVVCAHLASKGNSLFALQILIFRHHAMVIWNSSLGYLRDIITLPLPSSQCIRFSVHLGSTNTIAKSGCNARFKQTKLPVKKESTSETKKPLALTRTENTMQYAISTCVIKLKFNFWFLLKLYWSMAKFITKAYTRGWLVIYFLSSVDRYHFLGLVSRDRSVVYFQNPDASSKGHSTTCTLTTMSLELVETVKRSFKDLTFDLEEVN